MSIQTEFNTSLASVMTKTLGAGSIYKDTLTELSALYDSMGLAESAKTKIIAEVSAQLAIATTNTAINAAVDLAKASVLVDAQVAEMNARTLVSTNQAATEIVKALDVVSSTAVRDAQSAKDLLVKDAQIADAAASTSVKTNQAATEIVKALDVVSSTAVRDAQSAQDLLNKAAQVTDLTANTSYTNAKSLVTTQSRIDNLVLEVSKSQEQKIATVGAGGLVVSAGDFKASNDLRNAIYTRATGSDLPVITFTEATTHTVAV